MEMCERNNSKLYNLYILADQNPTDPCGKKDESCGAGIGQCCTGLACDEGICDFCGRRDEGCGTGIGPCCKGLWCYAGVCTPT